MVMDKLCVAYHLTLGLGGFDVLVGWRFVELTALVYWLLFDGFDM